ncbi:hypothetical protein HDV00_011050 [Rhizophlyctis rosea]|nr:hypothetical protein HDV00_011050 [Rhizophlyctis rosea]
MVAAFSQSFADLSAAPDESVIPTVPIKDGRLMVESPGYCWLREKAGDKWEKVRYVLEKVEEFVRKWDVRMTSVTWDAVVRLALTPLPPAFDKEDLIMCFANANAIRQLLTVPGQRYRGEGGENAAAAKIQATWKMSVRRRIHLWYLDRLWAAQIFAKRWRIKKVRRRLKEMIETQYQNVHLKRYNRILTTFRRDEGALLSHRRVIVMLLPSRHPGSLNSFPDAGVGCAFLLTDPQVDIIFLTPLLDEERIGYLKHMMATTFPMNNPLNGPTRLRFVIPEAARCFREGSSLANIVVASRRAVKEVRKLVAGRNAVLCGVQGVGRVEVELSSVLNIPLYAPTPTAYASHLAGRSAARSFLRNAGCKLLPCVTSRAENEDDFVVDVMRGVVAHPEIGLWMLWSEANKGVDVPEACLDPTSIPIPKNATADEPPTSPTLPTSPTSPTRPKTPFTTYIPIAQSSLPSAIRLISPTAPRTWKGFVSKWCDMGGGTIIGFPVKDMKDRALTVTLSTGCKFDPKDLMMKFIRPDLPAGMKHFEKTKYVDMTKARSTFNTRRLPNIDPIEARVACYVFGAEHQLITEHSRRVLVGAAIRKGEVFDEWMCQNEGACHLSDSAIHDALKLLMKLNWQIDAKGTARTEEWAVPVTNFMTIATRLLSEFLTIRRPTTPPKIPDPLVMTLSVQKSLQELGYVPRDSPQSTPTSRLQTAQTPSQSRPSSRLIPRLPSRPLIALPPSLSNDLEALLQCFIRLPPATLFTDPPKPKPKGPVFQISPETQSIILQGIPSWTAAKSDATFRRPVISPPYSRRASAERARGMEGKNKRARAMLAKMEEEIDAGRPPIRKGKRGKGKKETPTGGEEASAIGATSRPSAIPGETPPPPLTDRTMSIATRVKAAIDHQKALNTDLEASEKRVEKLGIEETKPFTEQPRPSVMDDRTDFEISKALMRLADVKARESTDIGMEERMKEAKRLVEERHRKVLEAAERKEAERKAGEPPTVSNPPENDLGDDDSPKARAVRRISIPTVLPEHGRRRMSLMMYSDGEKNWDKEGKVLPALPVPPPRIRSRRSSSALSDPRLSQISDVIAEFLEDMHEES